VFQTAISIFSQERYTDVIRPAYILKINISNSYIKYKKFNCKGKRDPKYPAEAGFIYCQASKHVHEK
jgi:hypothetical protein